MSVRLSFICLLVVITIVYSPFAAAQGTSDCQAELADARAQYARGQFDSTISLMEQCISKPGLSEENRRAAYRLIGLSYIGKGLEVDARASVRRLLSIVPSYQPDPVLDPPDFVNLVNEVKEEMNLPSNPTNTDNPPSRVVDNRNNERSSGPDRSGFTLLINLGYGFQNDSFLEESTGGLAGLNLGIGGFLSEDLALLFRFSGTNVNYDLDTFAEGPNQVSGVVGASVQYWPSDAFYLEGGAGIGFYSFDGGGEVENDQSFGIILGAGFTVFNSRRNNLQIGVEYAPAFIEEGTIGNVGITFGYQLL